MRVSAFVAVSLDGYFAQGDGSQKASVAIEARPSEYGFGKYLATVDAIILGRHTYERLRGFRHWPYADRPVFVLSTRAVDVPLDLVRYVESTRLAPDPLLSRLQADGHKHVFVDGGITIQRFLGAMRLDEITITRLPCILGGGRALFGPGVGVHELEHLGSSAFADGVVQSRYRINGTTLNVPV